MKGQHQNDITLQEDYLDWFFLSYYQKDSSYWKSLTEEKLEAILTLENEKEQRHWDTWIKIYSKIYGTK